MLTRETGTRSRLPTQRGRREYGISSELGGGGNPWPLKPDILQPIEFNKLQQTIANVTTD
ncbi:MAG: hypothetical protein COB51_04215 [Moraxellaceae bacterium]|nr:MAG: hypothetical protein COB51_04215 [Moraxellaceae bacterium]